MSILRGYFWYSDQQGKVIRSMRPYDKPNYCKVGDKVLMYTEMTSTPVNTSKWDDMVFLGKGIYVEHYLYRKETREVIN